jgi:hypothetical protein
VRVLTCLLTRCPAYSRPAQVDLKIKGAAFVPKQLLGVSLASVPAPHRPGPWP